MLFSQLLVMEAVVLVSSSVEALVFFVMLVVFLIQLLVWFVLVVFVVE